MLLISNIQTTDVCLSECLGTLGSLRIHSAVFVMRKKEPKTRLALIVPAVTVQDNPFQQYSFM